MFVYIIITVVQPSSPEITNMSLESNNITISWINDDTVDSFKVQYSFTIIDCDNDMQSSNYLSPEIEVRNNTFAVFNSSIPDVDENYFTRISLTAVNLAGESKPTIINNEEGKKEMYNYYHND